MQDHREIAGHLSRLHDSIIALVEIIGQSVQRIREALTLTKECEDIPGDLLERIVVGAVADDVHGIDERYSSCQEIRDFLEKEDLVLRSEASSVYGLQGRDDHPVDRSRLVFLFCGLLFFHTV